MQLGAIIIILFSNSQSGRLFTYRRQKDEAGGGGGAAALHGGEMPDSGNGNGGNYYPGFPGLTSPSYDDLMFDRLQAAQREYDESTALEEQQQNNVYSCV